MRTGTDLPAPPLEERLGDAGGGSGWVELVTAKDDIDAHLVSGLLTNAGIESIHLHDVRAQTWLYGGADPNSPVRVMVRRLQLEDARLVLAEQAFEAPDYRAPEGEGRPRAASRHGPLWIGTAVAVGAILGALIMLQLVRPVIPCQLPVLCGAPAGQG